MNQLLRDITHILDNNEPLVLATVVSHDGSTPRGSGAKMAVRPGGGIVGTVGGGLLEAQAVHKAEELLTQPPGNTAFLNIDLTNELAAKSDMICGGHLTIFLEHMAPGGSGAKALHEVLDILKHGGKALLRSSFAKDDGQTSGHSVRRYDSQSVDTSQIKTLLDQHPSLKNGTPVLAHNGVNSELLELYRPAPPLFIFGAGHVSQPTATMASMVGFRTVVLDDRNDFANRERFPVADEIVVLPDFDNVFAGHEADEYAFIVIVTRGHLYDCTVLAQALRTPARYVGMIGSHRKRDAIYQALLEDGFSQQDIDRCHSPIGLSIGAQTPEEIAVSILAELVQCRSGNGA